MSLPNFKYFYNKEAKTLDVVMHGMSGGMDSQFITKITQASRNHGNSVVAFNFSFIDRGDEKSSGEELTEETEALQSILDYCQVETYPSVRLIGKSLGGIVAGKYLDKVAPEKLSQFSLVIFGYDTGYIDIKKFPGRIVIIQGSEDRFGNVEAVKQDLAGAASKEVVYYSVEGADHSYRNPETKEPVFEDEAVALAFK